MMNLDDLIEELTDLRTELAHSRGISEEKAGEIEVMIAYQPNYPLRVGISSVTGFQDSNQPVYLSSGGESNYVTKEAWDGGLVELEDLCEYCGKHAEEEICEEARDCGELL